MAKVVSVDKSFGSDGSVRHFVTTEDGSGSRTQIEVSEAEAKRFQQVIVSSRAGGPRILTETMPLT
jgi:hypothetical protein